MSKLSDSNRKMLKKISTATIATCLFKKGLRNQYINNVKRLSTKKENMVGEAFTLRYIPSREDRNPVSVFKNSNHPQRVAVESCPEGAILVFDSRKSAKAASAGSILATRLMKRGVEGMVTDGGFRDSEEISELNFHAYHQQPSAPTNLTLNEAIDINVPIACGDVAVFPGDILVGDYDGVMVIPKELIDTVVEECTHMTLYEEFVIEKVNDGISILGLYPPTDRVFIEEFEFWKSQKAKQV